MSFFIFVLLSVVLAGLIKGSVDVPLGELFHPENRPLLSLRLFRVLAGIVAGSGLAACGIALQAILRNPLAEPYLLGTSSGAGLGAVLAVILGIGQAFLPLSAFIGALVSAVLVYSIARQGYRIPIPSLILSGVVVSVAFSGIIVFLISVSSNEAVHGLMWWLWGSLDVYDPRLLSAVSLVVLAGIAVLFVFAQDLNALSLGEEEAHHLGVQTERVKTGLFILTSLMTACLVCVTGIIGFVGLIVPHLMRMVVGPNHKTLLPASCLAGASFLVGCDLIGRTVFSPVEIPIGVITAVVGAPVFIVLMKMQHRVRER